jgi:hypothetical protein
MCNILFPERSKERSIQRRLKMAIVGYSMFEYGIPTLHAELAVRLVTKEHLFTKSFSWANILYDIQGAGYRSKIYGQPVEIFGNPSHGFVDIQHGD